MPSKSAPIAPATDSTAPVVGHLDRPLVGGLVGRVFGCLLGLLLVGAACAKDPSSSPASVGEGADDTGASSSVSAEKGPGGDDSAILVTDDSTTILFSYVDDRGQLRSVAEVAQVPMSARERVLVVDLSRTAAARDAHRVIHFANLTVADADGRYPVTTLSRFEATKSAAKALPTSTSDVVVYSAVWCTFCTRAKAWLKAEGIPFVERDVEKTPGAAAELKQKLKAAGVESSGIPVIDWKGEIVLGFDVKKLTALAAAPATAPPATARPPSTPPPSGH